MLFGYFWLIFPLLALARPEDCEDSEDLPDFYHGPKRPFPHEPHFAPKGPFRHGPFPKPDEPFTDPDLNGAPFIHHGKPSYNEPSYNEPSYNEPSYNEPAYIDPTLDESTHDDKYYGQPDTNQPPWNDVQPAPIYRTQTKLQTTYTRTLTETFTETFTTKRTTSTTSTSTTSTSTTSTSTTTSSSTSTTTTPTPTPTTFLLRSLGSTNVPDGTTLFNQPVLSSGVEGIATFNNLDGIFTINDQGYLIDVATGNIANVDSADTVPIFFDSANDIISAGYFPCQCVVVVVNNDPPVLNCDCNGSTVFQTDGSAQLNIGPQLNPDLSSVTVLVDYGV
ncbi:hypothetical protein PFICI_02855 [Pestalotiopsis fici W106-1]|uniref:Uncharacterized protein n=1 Tax=Pestalotiopsis fici (strain W106-1 / CGMCC3.15140) TaxID=1229662 RepID=W3XFM3_PESFW|nr:uncharacterized protein PFICI_02855 [Pestalotiopsis fici W106-1]ETS84830.1 hypothetical protein PFICI_02855 [Pestalotiopsis fici W106-1]